MNQIENNTLIICPNEEKVKILKRLQTLNKLYNLKFMTKEEYFNNHFFEYNDKTILYLMKKYHYKVDVCKAYLKYLYVIDEEKNYKNKKLIFLQNIKKELKDNNLLIYHPEMKKYLETKNKVVLNYSHLDLYEEKVLGLKEEVNEEFPKFKITEYQTMEEEVNGVALEILSLIKQNIDIKNIILTNVSSDYYYTLDRIFSYYHIPLNIPKKYSIFGTDIVKKYLETNEISLDKPNKITKALTSIINSLVELKDDSREYQELLLSKIKEKKILKPQYENAVSIKDLEKEEFLDNEYVFVLGINQDILPRIEKDIAYISDKDKEELDLYQTEVLNIKAKLSIMKIFSSIKNLYLSYKNETPFQSLYPSSIIEEYNMEVIKPKEDTYKFSNLYNSIRLASKLDNFERYQEISPMLKELYTHYKIPYKTYDNKFSGIDKNTYLENLPYPLKLSYTSINSYNECKFKYYLNYVLKVNPYEDTFPAFLGSLYHNILQLYKNSDFNFEESYNKYLEKRDLSLKEKVLLVRLKQELLDLLNQEKELDLLLGYNEEYHEKKIEIPIRKDIEVIFTGTIDKIMFYKKIEDTYFAIVDYKSGTIDTKINKMKYGLSMQLPVYLFLINYSKVFTNPIFTGIYYQNILFNYPTFDKKPLEEIKKERIKLQGYSTDNIEILSRFCPDYEDSAAIKSMKYTEKGFSRFAKVLSDDDVYNILRYTKNKIDEATSSIIEGDFSINPKIYDGKNISCEFCNFKDICYHKEKDSIYLDKVEDLSFLEEEVK